MAASLIAGLDDPGFIAAAGGDLFITDDSDQDVGEYTTGGVMVRDNLIANLNFPEGVAVSGNDLFVANQPSDGEIDEYALDGTAVMLPLISNLESPQGITVLESSVFVADDGSNAVGEYTTAGGIINPQLISGFSNVLAVATDEPTVVGPAAQLAFRTEPPTTATPGQTLSTFTVAVEDADGNIISGDDSEVTLAIGGTGGGALGGTVMAAAVNGVATFTGLSISQVGTYTLTASDSNLAEAVSTTITVSVAQGQIAPTSLAGDSLVLEEIGNQTQSLSPDVLRITIPTSSSSAALEDFVFPSSNEKFAFTYAATGANTAEFDDTKDGITVDLTFTSATSGTAVVNNPQDGVEQDVFAIFTPPPVNVAPSSLADTVLTLNIAGGQGDQFETSGVDTLTLPSGTAVSIAADGVLEGQGTYSYKQTIGAHADVARMVIKSGSDPAANVYLVFTTPTSGTFYTTDTTSSNTLTDLSYGTFSTAPAPTHLVISAISKTLAAGQARSDSR